MSYSLTRRRFMQATSSAVAVGALSSVSSRVSAQSSGQITAVLGGGDWGKANIEAYAKPFEAETGIKVIPITDDIPLGQLELMVKANNVTVDVAALAQGSGLLAAKKGILEKIDYSIYEPKNLNGIYDFAKQPFGIASLIYSYNMVYNTEVFPADKPRPLTWAEFWDVEKFPGVRTLVTGQYGSEGPWEEALLADGVPADQLYPMDIDRVFASLDKIKPHIRKWWGSGSEIQQMLHDKVIDIAQSYDGRALLLVDQGAPVEINRNQAKLQWDYWVVPKGSSNVQNAQKFIEFATRADRQAAFAQLFPEGPSNRNAFELIPDQVARKLPTHPDYMKNSVSTNGQWYNDVGPDGLSNTERLMQRWNEWILQ
ncbi:ABC transporter substrate-binding protein [Mesorhizobium sp.]|uniref:ABC transporter substrate-binding protein n=1 Tax=Mesorhizobium sp. TaxID=1871066 RepID=UPI000FE9241E|nr:ABC transporter substrate-binding protein [Mesorhizobium sp.]RWJ02159.1 MAG: ABC transporter substrate-binding protein [Mesorhizobium sp.]RWM08540.1 MAG: ABC transporter substrate-binding protein [Mesorhizobium sp.]RWO93069.1 MAG: ABC transporter substrate-binding protein [Mesorhizobium sp.]